MSENKKKIILDPNTKLWFEYKLHGGDWYFVVITHTGYIHMYWDNDLTKYLSEKIKIATNKECQLKDTLDALAYQCWQKEWIAEGERSLPKYDTYK